MTALAVILRAKPEESKTCPERSEGTGFLT